MVAGASAIAADESSGLSSLHVPGGTSALLSAAGLDPARPRATAMLDIIRVVHELPDGADPQADERRARLRGYLEAIAQFERTRVVFPSGRVTLARVDDVTTRASVAGLARALGSSLERENGAYRLRPGSDARSQQRREALLGAGLDVPALEATLNAGGEVTLALQGDEVPLPLPAPVWQSLPVSSRTSEQFGGALVSSILGDRPAALLYYGVTSMDEDTRRYLAAAPGLVGEIYGGGTAGTLALYGRSLRVRHGRIVTPGPPEAAGLWEALAGERVTTPERFVLAVLGRDGGRLALLYDAVAHMDAPRQAFALGLWRPDADARRDRFEALYDACAPALAGWDPAVRPFARGLYDPAHLLLLVRAGPDGRPAPPAWHALWRKVFDGDGLPADPRDDLGDVEADGLVDAARLVETVLTANHAVRRTRAEAWLFAQRAFGHATVANAPGVFVAIRGFMRFRTLALTLERLGITDPLIYVSAFGQAQRLADIGDRERTATALGTFQGALVLVERARLSRVIDADVAGRLVSSLSEVPMTGQGEYLGGIAAWIDGDYLPAIGRPIGAAVEEGGASSLEADVLGAFAGRRADAGGQPEPAFDYEGFRYRADPAAAERVRMQGVRARQAGASLDAVMQFAREVLTVSAGIGDVSRVPSHVAALQAAVEALQVRDDVAAVREAGEDRDLDEVRDAIVALGKVRTPKQLARVGRIALPLQRAVDHRLGSVLMSLAYAFSLGDPENPALIAGDPSPRHDWGLIERDAGARARAPWTLPVQGRDSRGRWHVSGSLLALDVGLGDFALRRISNDALADAPTITANERWALTEAVVLAGAFDYRDADMALIAGALGRGRARVAALPATPASVPGVIADADLDDTRRPLLAWAVEHDPEHVAGMFSLGDLLALGQRAGDAMSAPDAWGTSGLSFDGRLGLRPPDPAQRPTLSGRRGKGLLATFVPDVALQVAETLHDHGLPASLARPVLAVATQEVIERVAVAHEDDWMGMVSALQRYLPGRMDDYLASVITGGYLVPVSQEPGSERVP